MATRLARALLTGALLTRIFLPLARADPVEVGAGGVPVDVESGVQQIHMAQGKDPTSMVISWLTPNTSQPAPASQVRYGLSSDALTMAAGNNNAYTYTIPAGYAKPPMNSAYPLYTSGWLHNVELTGLQPDTLYFYQVGGLCSALLAATGLGLCKRFTLINRVDTYAHNTHRWATSPSRPTTHNTLPGSTRPRRGGAALSSSKPFQPPVNSRGRTNRSCVLAWWPILDRTPTPSAPSFASPRATRSEWARGGN